MATIKNAAPRSILEGIRDASIGVVLPEAESVPMHLPHVFLFTERGPREPQLVSGAYLTRLYGARSFDPREKFANHQTILANVINGRGNAMMVQRLVPADAKVAGLRISLDLLADNVPQYQRDVSGAYILDANGAPTTTGASAPGHIGKLVVSAIPANGFGQGTEGVGSQLSSGAVQSRLIPIMDLSVSHEGAYGNLLGLRLSAPTVNSSIPVDGDLVNEIKSALYRIQFVERPDANSLPNVVLNNYGEQYVEFSFKEGAINTKTDSMLFVDDVVIDSYQELSAVETPPVFGPFGKMHVYHDKLQEVLEDIYAQESTYGRLPATGAEHMINIFTGVDYNGIPFSSYIVKGPLNGGVLFNENTTHYAQGGVDGDLSLTNFDTMVGNVCANYGTGEFPFLDSAKYPQSAIWDSGFTIATKKKLLTPIGLRKDIYVILSTQDVSAPQNTAAQESSTAVALRAAARLFPESEVHGTSVCRALVIGHSGKLLNSQYKGLLPLTIEFADKVARWMGAGSGVMKDGIGFDIPPYNQISMFKADTVNCTYKPSEVRNRDWDAGLVWVQNYDRRSLFFPGIQTVYDEDTSIMNSAVNMMIAVELEKVADRTWRDLTGISSLTVEQFIERSNTLIEEKTKDRFDGRVIVRAETYMTEADNRRGYSWACQIHMYGNNMRTVGTFTIVPHRAEELDQ